MTIFAGQVSDSPTIIYTPQSVDFAHVYIMCPEIPGHSVELHLLTQGACQAGLDLNF